MASIQLNLSMEKLSDMWTDILTLIYSSLFHSIINLVYTFEDAIKILL